MADKEKPKKGFFGSTRGPRPGFERENTGVIVGEKERRNTDSVKNRGKVDPRAFLSDGSDPLQSAYIQTMPSPKSQVGRSFSNEHFGQNSFPSRPQPPPLQSDRLEFQPRPDPPSQSRPERPELPPQKPSGIPPYAMTNSGASSQENLRREFPGTLRIRMMNQSSGALPKPSFPVPEGATPVKGSSDSNYASYFPSAEGSGVTLSEIIQVLLQNIPEELVQHIFLSLSIVPNLSFTQITEKLLQVFHSTPSSDTRLMVLNRLNCWLLLDWEYVYENIGTFLAQLQNFYESLSPDTYQAEVKQLIQQTLALKGREELTTPNRDSFLFFDWMKLSPTEFARQLTIYHETLWEKMHPSSILRYASKQTGKNALGDFVSDFNALSFWVKYTIFQHFDIKKRRKIIQRHIDIGLATLKLNNFHAVFSITSALTSAPVARLRMSWDPRMQEQMKDLNEIMNPEKNFKNYRAALESARSACCIPYSGLFLGDQIHTLDALSKNTADKDKINICRYIVLSKFAVECVGLKSRPYEIDKKKHAIDFLKHLCPDSGSTEHIFYDISLYLEPKGAYNKPNNNVNEFLKFPKEAVEKYALLLHTAVENEELSDVKAILVHPQLCTFIDTNNPRGDTPLISAVLRDNFLIVLEMLNSGVADLNAVNAYGETALQVGVRMSSQQSVALLLAKGADTPGTQEQGNSKFLFEKWEGGGAKALQDTFAVVSGLSHRMFEGTIRLNTEKAREHASRTKDFSTWNEQDVSAWLGELGLPKPSLQILIAQELTGDILPSITETHLAEWQIPGDIAFQLMDAIRVLSGQKTQLKGYDEKFVESLCNAATEDNVAQLKLLLLNPHLPQNINAPNSRGQPALYCAARQGAVSSVVELCCRDCIDINFQVAEHGCTPLHAAVYGMHFEVAAALLARGANPNLANKKGMSARAEAKGELVEVFQLFQEQGTFALVKKFPIIASLLLPASEKQSIVSPIITPQFCDLSVFISDLLTIHNHRITQAFKSSQTEFSASKQSLEKIEKCLVQELHSLRAMIQNALNVYAQEIGYLLDMDDLVHDLTSRVEQCENELQKIRNQ